MGPVLNASFASFADELEKIAAVPRPGMIAKGLAGLRRAGGDTVSSIKDYGKGWGTTLDRTKRIGRGGLTEGWNAMAPQRTPAMMDKIRKTEMGNSRFWTTGSHLRRDPQGFRRSIEQSGPVKGVAEELSRRGWTGQGNITKYVPLGEKGLGAGFAGIGAKDVYNAATDPTAREYGGPGEIAMSELGAALPWILSAGAGGGMLFPVAGMIGGGMLGRKLDKAREGR